jgi:high affinity sulfate transporter 1
VSTAARLVPGWLLGYRREWLAADVVAGVIVWSVVVPQAVAYAQIAGLPPEAGLMAAPGALLAYALLGTSRTLVVSATTATSALSASAVGPLADGDTARYAALSAGLALVAAAALAVAGLLRLGRITDLVSTPVMTGFLFGLGLTVAAAQATKLLGVEDGSGDFVDLFDHLVGELENTEGWTVAVAVVSIAALVALRRYAPRLPGTVIVLVGGIVVSALFDLSAHGVDVVGKLPRAVPEPAWPDVSWADAVDLLPAALGMLIVSAEAIGVSRGIAAADGYQTDPNRDLVALGGSNLLAGLSQGFVQSGGASQTMAAEQAGGKTQVGSLVAGVLIVLTGAFLTGLFRDLPQATLAAIVIVAIAGFFRVGELVRFARLRRSAIALALVALVGVLALGVLPGLLVAAGLSLVLVVQKLSRPSAGVLARDPASGAWARSDRHPDWEAPADVLVARVDGPLFYANAVSVKERLLELVRAREPRPGALVLELAESPDLDVGTLDAVADLAAVLANEGMELRLSSVRVPARGMLERGGLDGRVRIEPTVDAAVEP